MIGQKQEDHDDEETHEVPHRRVMLAEDDLEVGQYVCVHSLKRQPNEVAPIMGQSLQIKAINWPYFVGQLLSDPCEPILTLDCRFLNMMRVTKEFVDAQREGAKQEQAAEMMQTPQKRRRGQQDG